MSLTLTLATFSLYLLSVLLTGSAVTESELRSLLEFRKGIEEDPTGKTLSWPDSVQTGSDSCLDSWHGISCDPDTSSIVGINLDNLGLSGELKFATLIGLNSLRNLSLSGNNLTGRLVPTLGSMSSLQYLDLSDNSFYGPIPARIGDLWGLNYLNLSGNKFRGGFPAGFRNLQQLRSLDLHENELWGDIGEIFSELRNVEVVDLSYNQFFGGLPVKAENVSSLVNTLHFLNLSHNSLNGGFFEEDSIGLYKNLVVLDLGDNQITGELPSFSLMPMPNFRALNLRNNQLFGSVPQELLQNSIPMQELDLSGNAFTGSIPEINSTTLNLLNLSSNGMSGTLPSTLKRCLVLDLSKNSFSGDVAILQKWEASLEFLDLSSNKLSGSIPNLTSQFAGLTVFNLRNNSLDGTLASLSDISQAPKLSVLDFSSNQLNGPIPSSFFTSTNLKSLNLSRNQFTGPVPIQGSQVTELLVLSSFTQMESLDLSVNSLSGVLLSDIGNMGRLKVLNLAENDLFGQLPVELNKLTDLRYLDLSNNKFNGEIPEQLSSTLVGFNVSYNNLSGSVPENLKTFPWSSFHPGNPSLQGSLKDKPVDSSSNNQAPGGGGRHKSVSTGTIVGIIIGSIGAVALIVFVLFAYRRSNSEKFHGRSSFNGQSTDRDIKSGRSLFNFRSNVQHPSTSLSFSNDHLLTSGSGSLSIPVAGTAAALPEPTLPSSFPNVLDNLPTTSARNSSPSSSPRFIEASEQPVMLDVYSPDRLAGELFFLDNSLKLTAEELSRAPAEVLGRSSHGTLYKATLGNGHMLTVKWLRVGLVKHKKEFAKEVKKIGSITHPNIVPLRAYYWGPREQERLLLADFVEGDSLALHLYETTPRRYSHLTFSERLRVSVDVTRCLLYLHDRGITHGNIKPTNIILSEPDNTVRLTDYGLHRLMTPAGIAEQILNLGAFGYRAPELATMSKPAPSFKGDVYALGVILMELLTRRSAGDIISGQSGAVDLTDWVRLCDQEGRRTDCIDRDMAGNEEPSKAMDDMLGIALRCILPVNERPNIRHVFDDLSAISA